MTFTTRALLLSRKKILVTVVQTEQEPADGLESMIAYGPINCMQFAPKPHLKQLNFPECSPLYVSPWRIDDVGCGAYAAFTTGVRSNEKVALQLNMPVFVYPQGTDLDKNLRRRFTRSVEELMEDRYRPNVAQVTERYARAPDVLIRQLFL